MENNGYKKIETVNDYINKLKELLGEIYKDENKRVFFRGEDRNYVSSDLTIDTRCLPKAFRPDQDEYASYYRFLRRHPEEFEGLSNLGILSKMQHYGIPTRLLDITANPLVALFFACGGADFANSKLSKIDWQNDDGHVYIFTPNVKSNNKNNILTMDSDRALLLSTLAKMNEDDKIKMDSFITKFKGKQIKPEHIEDDSNENEQAFSRFIYECRREREAFRDHKVKKSDLSSIFFVKSSYNIIRMKLQAGLFIIFGIRYLQDNDNKGKINTEYFREKVINLKSDVSTIIIPKASKANILAELKFLYGISYATLFGDLAASVSEPKDDLYDQFRQSMKKTNDQTS